MNRNVHRVRLSPCPTCGGTGFAPGKPHVPKLDNWCEACCGKRTIVVATMDEETGEWRKIRKETT